METQTLNLTECCTLITAENVMLNKSSFSNASMRDISISDADLSDMVIDGAQIGGATIKNIGMPDDRHPNYNPNLYHRPVSFEMCDLNNSKFESCDLSHVKLENCNIAGLTINGIAIDKLIGNIK